MVCSRVYIYTLNLCIVHNVLSIFWVTSEKGLLGVGLALVKLVPADSSVEKSIFWYFSGPFMAIQHLIIYIFAI